MDWFLYDRDVRRERVKENYDDLIALLLRAHQPSLQVRYHLEKSTITQAIFKVNNGNIRKMCATMCANNEC